MTCMLACIFGLAACGSEKELTEYEKNKVAVAQEIAVESVIPLLDSYTEENEENDLSEFTMEEIAYQVEREQYQLYQMTGQRMFGVDGYAFYSAVESFRSGMDSVGGIQSVGTVTSKIDGDQIIVDVEIVGVKKDAVVEVIFSNDRFLVMESAALNPVSTMGELMTGAALNTLIGMGTVFTVLILISCIISCFRVIPAIQKKFADNKTKKTTEKESSGVDNAVTQIVDQEEISGDDLELAAVIAAAIAAFEGSASTDGFVVRSIRRQRNI